MGIEATRQPPGFNSGRRDRSRAVRIQHVFDHVVENHTVEVGSRQSSRTADNISLQHPVQVVGGLPGGVHIHLHAPDLDRGPGRGRAAFRPAAKAPLPQPTSRSTEASSGMKASISGLRLRKY